MAGHVVARGLTKAYRKGKAVVPVLMGVDLDVDRGEFVAITGASGSGKSTLLHLLGLIDVPDGGTIEVGGQRIDNLPGRRRDAVRNNVVGFIFQFYHLLPEFSALDNVLMPLAIRHGLLPYLQKRSKFRAEAASLLERVGLGHRLDHKPTELSGGEIQRAAIARAVIAGPSVLLADEPTGNLDAGTGSEVLRLLNELNRERGLTLILVTHDPSIASRADRVVRLEGGLAAPCESTIGGAAEYRREPPSVPPWSGPHVQPLVEVRSFA